MNKLTETEKAYIAGLFDGEGSVDYAKRKVKNGRSPNAKKKYHYCWKISCRIGMGDKYVLEWLHETLGFGTLRPRKVPEGMKPHWVWQCGYQLALQFAKLMWPYTQTKLHKLEQIIDHYADMDPLKKHHYKKETITKPTAKIYYLKDMKKPNAS